MSPPSEADLTREIQEIINEAVRTDPVLEHFSLRDVKRMLVARLGLEESTLKEPRTKELVRSATTRIVEQALQRQQAQDGDEGQEHGSEDVPPSDAEELSGADHDHEHGHDHDHDSGRSDPSISYSPRANKSPEPEREEPSEPEPASEQSYDDDDEPPKRSKGSKKEGSRSKASTASQSRSRAGRSRGAGKKGASSSVSGPEAEVARLKSFVLACGVRKRWQSYFREHGAAPESPDGETDPAVLRRQARVLKELLAELGMTGRLSKEKAQKIKAERELQSELADIGVALNPNFDGEGGEQEQEPEEQGESSRQGGRKRRALSTSDDEQHNPGSDRPERQNKTPRKRANVEPPDQTPEIVRQRRAFRRALISDSDEE